MVVVASKACWTGESKASWQDMAETAASGSIARLFVEAEGGTAAGETGYVWRHGVRDKVKVYTAVQCKDEAETGSSGQARLCTVAQHKGQSKSMHDGAV